MPVGDLQTRAQVNRPCAHVVEPVAAPGTGSRSPTFASTQRCAAFSSFFGAVMVRFPPSRLGISQLT